MERNKLLKICVVQPIFAPNDIIFDKNIKSIDTLKNLRGDNVIIEYYFSGWCSEDRYWSIYDSHIQKLNPIKYLKQDKNYGKAYNINLLTSHITDCNFLLSVDSDILFLDNENYSQKIYELSSIESIGVISFNQIEGNCHLINRLNSKKEWKGHNLVWNIDGRGIAGGCLLIDHTTWKEVGGYRLMGVYAGDDGYFFLDVKSKKKFFALDLNTSIIHPHENDHGYHHWKAMVLNRDMEGDILKDISDKVDEATNFWKNR